MKDEAVRKLDGDVAFKTLDQLPAPAIPAPPEKPLTSFQAKHPGGRPSKYKPEYCDMVVADGKLGFSLTAFAASIDVDRDTITEWVSVHPQFSLACKQHKAHRTRLWEEKHVKIADEGGGQGSAAAVIFALKNVAPDEWQERSRTEFTGKDGGAIQTISANIDLTAIAQEDRELFRALLARAIKPAAE